MLAKLDKVDEAIRDTRDYIRTQSTMSLKHDYSTSGLDPSADIHKVTRSVTSYITVLSASYDRLVDPPIVLEAISVRGDEVEARLVPGENDTPSIHLIKLMMSSLEKKLTECRSRSRIRATSCSSCSTIPTSCGISSVQIRFWMALCKP